MSPWRAVPSLTDDSPGQRQRYRQFDAALALGQLDLVAHHLDPVEVDATHRSVEDGHRRSRS
jgi:hypothetical protein